jgi:hypothetical protein
MPHHQFQQQLVQQTTTTTTTTPSQHQNLLNQPQSLQLPTQSQSSLINNLNQSPSSNTISSSSQSSSPNSSSQQQQQQQQQHQHVAAAAAILAANRVFSNTSATSPFLNHHMNPYNHLTFNQHHPDMAALQNCLPNRHEQFNGVNLVSKLRNLTS